MKLDADLVRKHFEELNIMDPDQNESEMLGVSCENTKVELGLFKEIGIIILEGGDIDAIVDLVLNNTWNSDFLPEFPVYSILVQESHYEEFLSRLTFKTQGHIAGMSGQRFASKCLANLVEKATTEAIACGARIEVIDNEAGLWSPTIFREFKRPKCGSVADYAPVVSVLSFRTAKEAVTLAGNMVDSFNQASVWGADTSECLAVADGLALAKDVGINCYGFHHPVVHCTSEDWGRDDNIYKKPAMTQEEVRSAILKFYEHQDLQAWKDLFCRIEESLARGQCVPDGLNVLMRRREVYTGIYINYNGTNDAVAKILAVLYIGNKAVLTKSLAENQPFKAMLEIIPKNSIDIANDDLPMADLPSLGVEGTIQRVFNNYYQRKVICLPEARRLY